ncbi:TPA: C10 family peptidase [Enterococcus faecalis]|uniref:C10 family peptidase n=1 Tax=Enterococcus faecalis TaxID=1351 RepID=UPI0018E88C95|nr:peptidase C10 [Enterococcus faecalis]MBJ1687895.1 C10 family peptidase [Enterococcus faecalis]HBI1674833.1 C10 family peptidase [Enterococcus faecalis]HBI1677539.1 C10 family peptidase [Enterococcus faecalis]HBI1680668.1 C10 family peptidase [Enterococcus faecalis]
MKKIMRCLYCVIWLGIFSFSTIAQAEKNKCFDRSYEEAYEIAKDFFKQLGTSEGEISLVEAEKNKKFWVFNSCNGGFIIISADKRASDVLGYSETGTFSGISEESNINKFTNEYSKEMNFLQSVNDIEYSEDFTEKEINEKSIPLLDRKGIQFGQGYPYNLKTPKIELVNNPGLNYMIGQPSSAGCVAVATAQIMKYYNYPKKGKKDHLYYLLSENIGFKKMRASISKRQYNWNKILPTYTGDESEDKKEAVAELISDVGICENTTYGIESASNGTAVVRTLKTNFGYKDSVMKKRRDSYSDEEWIALLNSELENNRPIYYEGEGELGGHAFVIDGKNEHGYYHINWGWNGISNGYFKLDVFNPYGIALGGYNSKQSAIIGIEPK